MKIREGDIVTIAEFHQKDEKVIKTLICVTWKTYERTIATNAGSDYLIIGSALHTVLSKLNSFDTCPKQVVIKNGQCFPVEKTQLIDIECNHNILKTVANSALNLLSWGKSKWTYIITLTKKAYLGKKKVLTGK